MGVIRRVRNVRGALRAASILRREVASQAPHRLVEYSRQEPDPANALLLFPGQWASSLPGSDGPGHAALFEDARIKWLIAELQGVSGLSVLELGPLEGAHAYMLERAGAIVTSIEGNPEAFLRSLIVKNYFDLRATFLHGDFTRSFGSGERWDLIVASGVLYHMSDPAKLLSDIASATDRVFLWTHYFDPDPSVWSESIRARMDDKWITTETAQVSIGGIGVRAVPQRYLEALELPGFCGGPETSSLWLYKDDLLEGLRALGFDDIRIAFDEPRHQNGPAFAVLCQRSSSSS